MIRDLSRIILHARLTTVGIVVSVLIEVGSSLQCYLSL